MVSGVLPANADAAKKKGKCALMPRTGLVDGGDLQLDDALPALVLPSGSARDCCERAATVGVGECVWGGGSAMHERCCGTPGRAPRPRRRPPLPAGDACASLAGCGAFVMAPSLECEDTLGAANPGCCVLVRRTFVRILRLPLATAAAAPEACTQTHPRSTACPSRAEGGRGVDRGEGHKRDCAADQRPAAGLRGRSHVAGRRHYCAGTCRTPTHFHQLIISNSMC